MYLKSLTVRGFKSFASATTLEFEPGITCVVGPNGSGKSNVVDAIAWVMGEQGAKSLRGGKMEDVIFAGTSGRPPLGRAEVELVIDNSDGALPVDYTEVRISRILFRSGGSEYSINGESARLLDVQELLSDSGIGREMHVIVGQGRLDSVLQATPEDRRGFVEEAAGVLKHRKRKEKALRKLDSMGANLVRLQDLTTELRRQLKPLGRQAQVARRAQVIQADVRDARLRLLADDYLSASTQLGKEEADEAALLEQRGEAETGLTQARQVQQRVETQLSAAAPRLQAVNELHVRLVTSQERFSGMIQLASERIRHLRPDQPEQLSVLDPEQLDRQARQVRVEHDALAVVAAVAVTARDDAEKQRIQCDRELAVAVDAAKRTQRLHRQWRDELARQQSKLASHRSRAEARSSEIERLRGQIGTGSDSLVPLRSELLALEADHSEADSAVGELEAEAAAAKRLADTRRQGLDEARRLERETAKTIASARSRVETLELGATKPTSRADLDRAGVVVTGQLSELIRVEPGYEQAIESALAGVGAGDAVVVADWDKARAAIVAIGAAGKFRTTLVVAGACVSDAAAAGDPQPVERASTDDSQWPVVAGYTGVADLPEGAVAGLSLISPVAQAPAGFADAVASLLRKVVVAGDLEQAQLLVRRDPDLTVVTGSGDVLASHLVVSGPVGAGAIQLSRILDQAKTDLDAARATATAAGADLAQAEQGYEQARVAAKTAGAQLAKYTAARSEQFQAQRLLNVKIETIQKQVAKAGDLLAQAESALARDQDSVATTESELSSLHSQEPAESDAEESQLADLRSRLEAVRQVEVEARLAARSAQERAAAKLARAQEFSAAAAAERVAIEGRRLQALRRERQARICAEVLDQAQAALRIVEAALESVRGERDVATRERQQAEAELAQIRVRVEQLRSRLAELTDSVHRDELARAEQRLKIEQFAARALEEFGLDPLALVEEYGPDVLVPPSPPAPGDEVAPDAQRPEPRPYVREQQRKRLREAEKSLALLGRVNPLALEEFSAMEERQTFLTTQLEDLKNSRKDLLAIVTEVDERVRQVFAEAFADVAREFEGVFNRLFPGGEGRLVLTDPEDLLATGVEVEARPAGKRVKRLSLLSGGERSLTAMAFLVALFKARPSPFYLMDEVEAALDDSNLLRLIGLMEELRESSQLLVITHQKRTMEIADALYGVTMRDGVTRVISQRLREPEYA